MIKFIKGRYYEIEHPDGYPYLLYEIQADANTTTYAIGANEDQAQRRARVVGKAAPLLLADTIATKGYSGSNSLFKSHGSHWVCKDGFVFFRELT